jgi:hypothetical protein
LSPSIVREFVGLLAAISCCQAVAAEPSVRVAPEGKTTVVTQSGGATVAVTIETIKLPKNDTNEMIRALHCTSSREPCSAVVSMKVSVGDGSVFVPRSVPCRLSDLNTAEILTTTGGWSLRLRGGDASESYVATIAFDGTRVNEMRVFSGMVPDQPVEETVYHSVAVGD